MNVHQLSGNLVVGPLTVDSTNNEVTVGSGITLGNSGTITATNFSGNGSGLTQVNSDQGSWVNGASSNIHLAVSTDKVGIGTVSPATYLHLSANNSDPGVTEGDFVGTHDLTEYLRFTSVGDPGDVNAVSVGFKLGDDGSIGANPMGRLDICANHGSTVANAYGTIPDTTIATFLGSGNVGVGTSDPQRLLHLKRTEVATFLRIQNVNNNNGCGIELMRGNTDTWGATAWSDWRINNPAHLDFGVKFTGTDIPSVLHLNTTGNVGIGNSDPGAKLHIGQLDDDHLYLASGNNAYGWKLDTDDQGNGNVPFRIKKRSGGVDQTILTMKNQDGYVGVGGSDTPTARLTVFNSVTSSDNSIPAANLGENTAFPVTTHLWLANKHSSYAPYWGLAVGTIWSGSSYLQNLNKRSNTYYNLLLQPNGGRVGIGTDSPGAVLEVISGTEIPRLRGDAGRSLFMGSNYTHVNSSGFSETNLAYAWDGYPGVVRMNSGGEWRVHGQAAYNVLIRTDGGFVPFTGLHETYLPFDEEDQGKIVYSTGDYASELKDGNVDGVICDYLTVLDACPVVKICATENDKRVIGVLSTRHRRTQIKEISEEEYELVTGDEKYAYEKKEGTDVYIRDIDTDEFSRGYYNAVGEGSIWVCNKNGNFENGDYITSSTVAGYGQKQNDDLLHNYTVAKITADCDFSEIWVTTKKHKKTREGYLFDENKEPVYENILDAEGNTRTHLKFKIRYLLPDGTQISKEQYTAKALANEEVYIAAFVGCTYHCG